MIQLAWLWLRYQPDAALTRWLHERASHSGGLNSKLHAVCDRLGRPIILLFTGGQMSDHKGAALLFSSLPKAIVLLGDKGYDRDWFCAALASQGITACIPPKA